MAALRNLSDGLLEVVDSTAGWSYQDLVDARFPLAMYGVKLDWADPAKMVVSPCRIVEIVNVLSQVKHSGFSVSIDALLDAFLLQAAEKGLHHSVTPAVSPSAHARRLKMIGLAETTPSITGILRALV